MNTLTNSIRPLMLPALAAAVVITATSASAQMERIPRTGSLVETPTAYGAQREVIEAQNSRVEFSKDEVRQAAGWADARRFASCAMGFSEERVRGLLDQAVEGKAKRMEFEDFINRNQGCVATTGDLDRDFLRGALAEAVLTDESDPVAIPPGGNGDQVRDFLKTVKIANPGKDNPFAMAQMAAECRVALAPIQARALLATEAGSDAEKGALSVWKSVTPQCDGFKVADKPLSSWFDRAYSAQALYLWTDFAKAKA